MNIDQAKETVGAERVRELEEAAIRDAEAGEQTMAWAWQQPAETWWDRWREDMAAMVYSYAYNRRLMRIARMSGNA